MIKKRLVFLGVVAIAFAIGCSDSSSEGGKDAKIQKDQAPNDNAHMKDPCLVDRGFDPGSKETDSKQDVSDINSGKEFEVCENVAPQSLEGMKIEFKEEGNEVDNTWEFSKDKATLKGVGEFSYSYEMKDGTHSTVIFYVDGQDKYEMTWTSATGGTCTESFYDGTSWSPSVACTFKVVN